MKLKVLEDYFGAKITDQPTVPSQSLLPSPPLSPYSPRSATSPATSSPTSSPSYISVDHRDYIYQATSPPNSSPFKVRGGSVFSFEEPSSPSSLASPSAAAAATAPAVSKYSDTYSEVFTVIAPPCHTREFSTTSSLLSLSCLLSPPTSVHFQTPACSSSAYSSTLHPSLHPKHLSAGHTDNRKNSATQNEPFQEHAPEANDNALSAQRGSLYTCSVTYNNGSSSNSRRSNSHTCFSSVENSKLSSSILTRDLQEIQLSSLVTDINNNHYKSSGFNGYHTLNSNNYNNSTSDNVSDHHLNGYGCTGGLIQDSYITSTSSCPTPLRRALPPITMFTVKDPFNTHSMAENVLLGYASSDSGISRGSSVEGDGEEEIKREEEEEVEQKHYEDLTNVVVRCPDEGPLFGPWTQYPNDDEDFPDLGTSLPEYHTIKYEPGIFDHPDSSYTCGSSLDSPMYDAETTYVNGGHECTEYGGCCYHSHLQPYHNASIKDTPPHMYRPHADMPDKPPYRGHASPHSDEDYVEGSHIPDEILPDFEKIQTQKLSVEPERPVQRRRSSASSPKEKKKTSRESPVGAEKERRKPGRKPGQVSNVLHLWEFMRDLLQDKNNGGIIEWISKPEGVFRVVNSTEVARRWGEKKKNKKKMTYEKLSRSLRYSRLEGYFDDLPRDKNYPKKLCFKFGPKSKDWY